MYKPTLKLTIRRLAFATLLAVLTGCASHDLSRNVSYGNFVQDSPAASDQKMAADAVQRLITLYPPAHTRFDLQQITLDAFGSALVASLRSNGYALLEYQPSSDASDPAPPASQTLAPAVTAISSDTTLMLRYILDLDPSSQLYRVTLLVGNQSLTRAYLAQSGSVAAAGAWVRKE
jgi:hypothetical protein